jgi:hypothetical protein
METRGGDGVRVGRTVVEVGLSVCATRRGCATTRLGATQRRGGELSEASSAFSSSMCTPLRRRCSRPCTTLSFSSLRGPRRRHPGSLASPRPSPMTLAAPTSSRRSPSLAAGTSSLSLSCFECREAREPANRFGRRPNCFIFCIAEEVESKNKSAFGASVGEYLDHLRCPILGYEASLGDTLGNGHLHLALFVGLAYASRGTALTCVVSAMARLLSDMCIIQYMRAIFFAN